MPGCLRRTIISLLFILVSAGHHAQLMRSSFTASDSICRLYSSDADRLAVRRVHKIHSSYKDSVQIDRTLREKYLKALIAVYNATALPATDTITRLLEIHSYNPGLNSLVILADSNIVWASRAMHNVFPTQDLKVDALTRKYDLKKVFYSGLFQPAMLVFRTDSNSNLEPLANKFKTVLGVSIVETDLLYGDGNDITDSTTVAYTDLIYSYGWDDCSDGCQQRRFWQFRVYPDYWVEYRGSYGNALEAKIQLSTDEADKNFKNIKVYPNPAKEKLYVECNDSKIKDLRFSLSSAKGKEVYSQKKINDKEEINMILLSNGLYYLTLQTSSQQKVFKVTKR